MTRHQELSVESVATAVQTAGSTLPHDEFAASARHAAEATEQFAALAHESPSLGGIVEPLAIAGEAAYKVASALSVADESLVAYRATITGTGYAASGEGIEADGHAARVETAQDASVFVVTRQVGNTTFNVVLCEHTAEHAKTIAASLAGNEVIAIESPGLANEEGRAVTEQAHTMLLSSKHDPAVIRGVLAKLPPSDAVALYSELVGCDAQVVLLDIARDHPDYPVLQRDMDYRPLYADAIVNILPVDEARRRTMTAAVYFSEAVEVRDRVIAQQLATLPQRFGKADIGVMMGGLHHGAIAGLGDPTVGDIDAVRRSLHSAANFGTLVDAIHSGQPLDPAQVDRHLLKQYAVMADRRLVPVLGRMSDEWTRRTLDVIDDIARSPLSASEKRRRVDFFLHNVADLFENSAEEDA